MKHPAAFTREYEMMQKLTEQPGPDSGEVFELLARRAQVQGWIQRLEENAEAANERIVARVRADYQARLQETVDRLMEHRSAVQSRFEHATEQLAEAEREAEALADELEEARLRNLIGELNDARWSEQRKQLDARVEEAADREAAAREEVSRLGELLAQIEEREETDVAPAAAAGPAPAEGMDDSEDIEDEEGRLRETATEEDVALFSLEDTLEEGGRNVSGPPNQPVGFLADIDRALSGKANAETGSSRNGATLSVDNLEDTAPKPGLKCGECGYTNDLGAWFCGVCGADVG
jgi:chromosome segregation ATPase